MEKQSSQLRTTHWAPAVFMRAHGLHQLIASTGAIAMETDVPRVLFKIDATHCKTAKMKLCLAHRRYSIKCVGVCYSVLKEHSC